MNKTIYLPDDLGVLVQQAGLNVSQVCQDALRRAVEEQTGECSRCGADLLGDKSMRLTDPAVGQCAVCKRLTWATGDLGALCEMTQPDGSRCQGVFLPLNREA